MLVPFTTQTEPRKFRPAAIPSRPAKTEKSVVRKAALRQKQPPENCIIRNRQCKFLAVFRPAESYLVFRRAAFRALRLPAWARDFGRGRTTGSVAVGAAFWVGGAGWA